MKKILLIGSLFFCSVSSAKTCYFLEDKNIGGNKNRAECSMEINTEYGASDHCIWYRKTEKNMSDSADLENFKYKNLILDINENDKTVRVQTEEGYNILGHRVFKNKNLEHLIKTKKEESDFKILFKENTDEISFFHHITQKPTKPYMQSLDMYLLKNEYFIKTLYISKHNKAILTEPTLTHSNGHINIYFGVCE